MASLSRREKYKELRDQLQHDSSAGENLNTPELSRFSKKLNGIDPDNFEAPQQIGGTHDAAHAKVQASLEEIATQIEEQAAREPVFSYDNYKNENDTDVESNEIMDEVIREVKKYNIENGNAVSQNTSMNIMREIKGPARSEEAPKPVSTPYPNERKRSDTADIPFMSPFKNYDDDENTEKIGIPDEEEEPAAEPSQTMSREDIMAEVQNLVNGKPLKQQPRKSVNEQLYSELEDDRTTRQRLLNETTQMRAQLDGYEDNLSEVNDKMRYTNRILNLVLVVLIIALVVILFILIYWVVLSRGA